MPMLTTPFVLALQSSVVIRDVTIIDGPSGTPRPGQTVVPEGGRSAAVSPSAAARPPAGARVTDGRGRHLLPGFIDTQAHVAFGPVRMALRAARPASR